MAEHIVADGRFAFILPPKLDSAKSIRKDMMDMIAFSAKNNIESIVDVMPFLKMNEAIDMVRKKMVSTRLVLENRS